jgi:hypothetical protein
LSIIGGTLQLKGIVMRLPALRLIFPAILFCSACLVSPANAQTKSNKKEPVATVSGKVTIKGKPAPGIVVGMRLTRPEQFSPTFKGVTDQDGTYHIADVVAGSYQVAPVAPAFVISDVDNSSGLMVTITQNENVEDVNFDLVRGGVITGRITDSEGRPLIEEQVNLLAADQSNRGPGNYISNSFRTDDRGIYRMFGIRPGRYKVGVGSGEGDFYRGNSRGRAMVATTFYPDTPDATKATVIEIAEGTEANKIDIVASRPVEGFSASGRIVNAETGKGVPGLAIGLSRIVTIDSRNTSSYGVHTDVSSDAQGEFHLKDLRPGDYEVQVYLPQESDLRYEDPGGRVKFQIVNQDVTGLIVQLSAGASVSGTVVLEGGKVGEMPGGLSQAWISVNTRSDSQGPMSGRSGQLKPDGSFRLGGLLPGIVTFSAVTRNGATGVPLTVSRIERDGVVVQPNGITIQSTGDHITGLRLVVGSHVGSVRGIVKFENGPLPPGGRLVVQLLRSGGDPSMEVRGAEVDSRGHFSAQGLAAGDYELRVFVYIPGSTQRPPMTKQIVTVTEGAATDVTVTLNLAPTPKP